MGYRVPQHIDQNQIFLVNYSELEGRWDPQYLRCIDSIHKDIILRSKFPIFILGKICNIVRGRFGHRPRNDPKFYNGEYPFIQTGDIAEASITGEKIQYTQTLNALGLLTSRLFLAPQLMMTIAANIGDTTILTYNACVPDSIVAIQPIDNQVLIEYLNIYFKITKLYLYNLAPYAAQRNINNQQLYEFPIVLPDVHMQQQIVDKYNTASTLRRVKLVLAQQKLTSIDDYLLVELGISMPKNDFQELNDRIFSVRFKDVVDNRFDPFYYLVSGKKVTSTSFANTQLKNIANIVKGNSITSDAVNKNGQYPVIAGGQTSPFNHDQYNFGGNVITISASGAYSGYVWYHEKPIFASDCSVIYSKDETKFLTRYIFEVLKVQQQQIYNLQQGAGQPHVYPEDLGKLIIPEVSLEKQAEIVAHISAIRAEAKALENEAEEVLTKAREEVEQMILNKA